MFTSGMATPAKIALRCCKPGANSILLPEQPAPTSERTFIVLSNEQYQQFQTFGFVVLRQFFTSDEVAVLSAEFENGLDLAYAGQPFDGSQRHWVQQMGPDTPFYSRLPEDERFWSITAQLYGEDAFAVSVDANRYVGDTGWHPDHRADPTEDCYGIKFAFYLDPVGPDSGALRLVPGSHKRPLHDDLRESIQSMGLAAEEIPSYVCTSSPGDVVAFDVRCWHASFGGDEGRRMSTCVYYKNPETPEEKLAARKRAASSRQTPAHFDRPDDPLFHPQWIANHENSALRQRWIERLTELGFLDSAN